MKTLLKSSIAVLAFALTASLSQAATITYVAILDGPSESPANASPGTGLATITVDDIARTIGFDITFSGLLGNTTAAHIHAATTLAGAGTAGVATQRPEGGDWSSGGGGKSAGRRLRRFRQRYAVR